MFGSTSCLAGCWGGRVHAALIEGVRYGRSPTRPEVLSPSRYVWGFPSDVMDIPVPTTTWLHHQRLHSAQSGLPPVPERLFSLSMLLPVLQLVSLWCTSDLIECQGDVFMTFDTSSADARR